MVYLFLAEGFEEIEALTPVDLLRRSGISVTTVGIGGEFVTGAHGITVKADICENDLEYATPEAVILPGGMPGTLNLNKSDTVRDFILRANEDNAYICAICAAPSVLGGLGLLHDTHATCYPGFEDKLTGATLCDCGVTCDGNIICGRAMGSAVDFALAVITALKGKDCSDKIRGDIIA